MTREVLQQALEALELPSMKTKSMLEQRDAAIGAAKAALAQPTQEPVAWIDDSGNLHRDEPPYSYGPDPRPLYTSPPQRQPLTTERVKGMMTEEGYDKASPQERADFINGIRHAEAAHDIGENT